MQPSLAKKINGLLNGTASSLVVMFAIVVIPALMFVAGVPVGLAMAVLPFALIALLVMLASPFGCYVILFLLNYFVIVIMRYTRVSGLSAVFDALVGFTFLSFLISKTLKRWPIFTPQIKFLRYEYGVLFAALLWVIYCCFETLNPSAVVSQWILSRGLVFHLFVVVALTFLVFDNFKKVETILMLLSVLTLIGVAKTFMQQVIGFDATERQALNEGLAITHLLSSGIRYFSIYVSAGILGAAMGHALVVFSIAALYAKSNAKRIYFIIVALLSLYAMLMSGTRGALVIPGAGFILFSIFTKQLKLMIPILLLSTFVYVFLAMTTIGQGNAQIRRARTIFDPNEPSLMVRLENQKLFREYLKDKPFGEGLGLSGVDVKEHERFTTSIPTDSWYVKIWVETGIVGLWLHIGIFAYILLHGAYIIMYKIKVVYLRGVLAAFHCANFGILISSYGNQVLGQFPIAMIVYMGMGLVFLGPYFDKQIEAQQQASPL